MFSFLLVTMAFGAGIGLGVLYFGGLWWTVRRVRDAQASTALLLGSFAVRSVIVLAGFSLVLRWMDGQWEMIAVSLLGFLGARFFLVRRWGPEAVSSPSPDLYTK